MVLVRVRVLLPPPHPLLGRRVAVPPSPPMSVRLSGVRVRLSLAALDMSQGICRGLGFDRRSRRCKGPTIPIEDLLRVRVRLSLKVLRVSQSVSQSLLALHLPLMSPIEFPGG